MDENVLDELEELEDLTLDLLAEVYSFSKSFLNGLSTKSDGFQDKFFEIIDEICTYFDTDEETANSVMDAGRKIYAAQEYFPYSLYK